MLLVDGVLVGVADVSDQAREGEEAVEDPPAEVAVTGRAGAGDALVKEPKQEQQRVAAVDDCAGDDRESDLALGDALVAGLDVAHEVHECTFPFVLRRATDGWSQNCLSTS